MQRIQWLGRRSACRAFACLATALSGSHRCSPCLVAIRTEIILKCMVLTIERHEYIALASAICPLTIRPISGQNACRYLTTVCISLGCLRVLEGNRGLSFCRAEAIESLELHGWVRNHSLSDPSCGNSICFGLAIVHSATLSWCGLQTSRLQAYSTVHHFLHACVRMYMAWHW